MKTVTTRHETNTSASLSAALVFPFGRQLIVWQ